MAEKMTYAELNVLNTAKGIARLVGEQEEFFDPKRDETLLDQLEVLRGRVEKLKDGGKTTPTNELLGPALMALCEEYAALKFIRARYDAKQCSEEQLWRMLALNLAERLREVRHELATTLREVGHTEAQVKQMLAPAEPTKVAAAAATSQYAVVESAEETPGVYSNPSDEASWLQQQYDAGLELMAPPVCYKYGIGIRFRYYFKRRNG